MFTFMYSIDDIHRTSAIAKPHWPRTLLSRLLKPLNYTLHFRASSNWSGWQPMPGIQRSFDSLKQAYEMRDPNGPTQLEPVFTMLDDVREEYDQWMKIDQRFVLVLFLYNTHRPYWYPSDFKRFRRDQVPGGMLRLS